MLSTSRMFGTRNGTHKHTFRTIQFWRNFEKFKGTNSSILLTLNQIRNRKR